MFLNLLIGLFVLSSARILSLYVFIAPFLEDIYDIDSSRNDLLARGETPINHFNCYILATYYTFTDIAWLGIFFS